MSAISPSPLKDSSQNTSPNFPYSPSPHVYPCPLPNISLPFHAIAHLPYITPTPYTWTVVDLLNVHECTNYVYICKAVKQRESCCFPLWSVFPSFRRPNPEWLLRRQEKEDSGKRTVFLAEGAVLSLHWHFLGRKVGIKSSEQNVKIENKKKQD